jgi:putative RecB family exonuclease
LEKSFNYKIRIAGRLCTIKGTIDRIDETANGIKIVDYKTGSPKDKLLFDDKEQLLIYQKAAADIFAKPVEALAFYYLENNSEMEFVGTAAELEKIGTKIVNTINDINKGEFPPKPSLLCGYCDFKNICEYRKI